MKKPFNPVIPDYTPRSEKKKVEEVVLIFKPCCNCGKKITDGYYGRWSEGGTCSKTCEKEQFAKPKYLQKGDGDEHVAVSCEQDS